MRHLRNVAIFLLVVGLLTWIEAISAIRDAGGTAVWKPIVWSGTSILSTGLLSFGIFHLTKRWPISKSNWFWRCVQHAIACVVFSILHIAMMVILRKLIYLMVGSTYHFGGFWANFFYEFSKDVFTYSLLVIPAYGWIFWKSLNETKLKALELETEVSTLRFQRLQRQLHPHFLFNTLNHISACMYEDVEKADTLLADLCMLLRHGLKEDQKLTVSLEEELQFLKLYTHLMCQRFGERLRVIYTVAPGLERAQVPCFLLQPLVENAIQHGFENKGGEGVVKIAIAREGAQLLINIRDDGEGLPLGQELREGFGLKNTTGMLEAFYGKEHLFGFTSTPGEGTRVNIHIPYSEEEVIEDSGMPVSSEQEA